MTTSFLPPREARPNWLKRLINIFAGTCAGINVTLVGHPFDTLKIRLQTQPQSQKIYSGLKDCFMKTLKWEGPKGLYSGVQSPLVGQMLFRATLFTSYAEAKRFFSGNGKKTLDKIHYFYAGGIGWGVGALIECPIDVFKTQLQIQIIKSKTVKDFVPEYKGFFDCFSKVISKNGIRGAYQGFTPHLLRNVPAGAVHLGTFELLRLRYAQQLNCKLNELPVGFNMLAGSIGGILFWGLFFPFDVIKSTMQADSTDKASRKYRNTRDCVTQMFKENGVARFYRGLSPCLLRAVPANAVLLYTNSYISENL